MDIKYIERKTGKSCFEKVYGHKALLLFYGDGLFRRIFSFLFLPLLARFPFFSRLYGYLQKSARSQKKIEPFINAYSIDKTEFVQERFATYNDFFIRKLKREKRPINQDSTIVATPADGRYLVYPHFQQFIVKGQEFSLREFLGSIALAHRFESGSMAIVRLCPTDYHRFHFPCDGIASAATLINGPLYSVNPLALKKRLAILSENKRMVTEIDTHRFGTMLYVEIGATFVGSIHQTYTPNAKVHKGDEKGYFEFGGSCIALFFERGRIAFDEDLIHNTQNGLETRINFGESLARLH